MNTPKTYLRGTKAEWLFIAIISAIFVLYETIAPAKLIINDVATYVGTGILLFLATIPILLLFVRPQQPDQDTPQK